MITAIVYATLTIICLPILAYALGFIVEIIDAINRRG